MSNITITAAVKAATAAIGVNVWGRGTDWTASIPNHSDKPAGPCIHSRATSRQAALRRVRIARAEYALFLLGALRLEIAYEIRNMIDQDPSATLAKLVKHGSDSYDLIAD